MTETKNADSKQETKKVEVKLPKGIDIDTYNKARAIIEKGLKDKQDHDVIKGSMMAAGVKYSGINAIFNAVGKSLGVIVDQKQVKDQIVAAMKKQTFKFTEDYATLSSLADSISGKIPGCTSAKVMTQIKKAFEDAEKPFPRQPATARGRMGVVNKTLINCFAGEKVPSQAEVEAELAKVCKTPKVANDYAKQYYKMLFAVKKGMTANVALTHFAKEEETAKKDAKKGDK